MDLLNMLMGSMSSSSSVEALSGKTGASKSVVSSLISAALPMLLSALTSNASSQEGAQSLLGALSQHTSTETMASQISNADEADGHAIIGHILGQNTDSVIQSLSQQTGASTSQVNSLLGNMAPAMMSGLSAATTSANSAATNTAASAGGFDFTDLLGAFGGAQTSAAQAQPVTPFETTTQTPSQGGLGGLLGGLFGGSSVQEQAPQTSSPMELFGGASSGSSDDGSSLLNSLLGFMK